MKMSILRFKTLSCVASVLLASAGTLVAADRDDQIEDAFKNSYVYRTQLKDTGVSISAEGGLVTLTGKVENEDQKRLAADTVEGLPGVDRVDNQITVTNQPNERSDDWIAMKVRGSLLFHRNVGIRNTDVRVNQGVVTLTGTASSEAEKSLAAVYASDIQGVQRVDNQIQVVENPDATVDANGAALRTNRVSNRDAGDRVERAGDRMENRAERAGERIEDSAERTGNRIENRAERAGDRIENRAERAGDRIDRDARTAGDKIDDASITAQLKYALGVRRSTSALKTEVTTQNGVVTIRGEAKNGAEKDLVTNLAKDIEGVRDVRNEMTVLGGS